MGLNSSLKRLTIGRPIRSLTCGDLVRPYFNGQDHSIKRDPPADALLDGSRPSTILDLPTHPAYYQSPRVRMSTWQYAIGTIASLPCSILLYILYIYIFFVNEKDYYHLKQIARNNRKQETREEKRRRETVPHPTSFHRAPSEATAPNPTLLILQR